VPYRFERPRSTASPRLEPQDPQIFPKSPRYTLLPPPRISSIDREWGDDLDSAEFVVASEHRDSAEFVARMEKAQGLRGRRGQSPTGLDRVLDFWASPQV
jgi:hypothetical protein